MEIRRPDPVTEFDEVLALVQACDGAVYGDSDWTPAELREEWDDLDLVADAWVAVDQGSIAGVVHVHGLHGSRMLVDGYVHPTFTGRGAGSQLLDAAEGRARELASQGLGLSLLQEGFRRCAEWGEATAALGVDSENPTGATHLHERAGMRVLWRAAVWRKELHSRA